VILDFGFSILDCVAWPFNFGLSTLDCRRRLPILEFRSLIPLQLCLNPVMDPVRIPPLDGIDGNPIQQHGEMQVIAPGQPGLAAVSDHLTTLHVIADLDVE